MVDRKLYSLFVVCALFLTTTAPAVLAQDGGEGVSLTLDQCLKAALKNNLDLVSARLGPELERQDIVSREANFDIGLESNLRISESEQAAYQQSSITGNKSATVDAGMAQNLNFGGDYSVGFGINRFERTGSDVFAPLSYTAGLSLNFNMPLLKGFGTEATTEMLVLARNDLDISLNDLEGQAETILQTVEGAYWNVLAASAALGVERQALGRAQDLLVLNRKKVEVGTLAPIQITEAEAGVADREEGVIRAETTLWDAEDELRRLLAYSDDDPIWDKPLLCTDRPDFEKKDIDLEAAIETALASRSEMFNARQTVRNRQLSERVAHRNVRHQLDFAANYGPRGSSLDGVDWIDTNSNDIPDDTDEYRPFSAKLNDAISNVFDLDEYDWSTTLTYRIPIGNKSAKADYTRAKLYLQQAEVNLRNQEQSIRVEVRKAVRAVESGSKRVAAAESNVVLQRKKLDAEQKKFDNGMSTSFQVFEFQNDLASAELREIQARLDFVRALTALDQAKGTLLEKRGLQMSL